MPMKEHRKRLLYAKHYLLKKDYICDIECLVDEVEVAEELFKEIDKGNKAKESELPPGVHNIDDLVKIKIDNYIQLVESRNSTRPAQAQNTKSQITQQEKHIYSELKELTDKARKCNIGKKCGHCGEKWVIRSKVKNTIFMMKDVYVLSDSGDER